MSCQIRGIAKLADVGDVKDVLFQDASDRMDHIPLEELPLQDCFVSLSSAGDVLAMAFNTRMIVLVSRWDSQEAGEVKSKFHIIWHGEVTKEQNEWVTSLICLPLVSLGKVSAGTGPDWTCIAIGFNTGFVRFYTKTGALLLGEQLHNESVIGLKCRSLRAARHSGDVGSCEELHVIYGGAVCTLQGFPLFSTLRACRNHLARVQAKCNDLPPITNLAHKKWGYRNQDIVNDAEVIGTTFVNSFDHLTTASICGGYNASYRSSAPQHNLVIATGKRPFIGFHYALEGGAAPDLSDVAIAMASKLANAIGTAVPWFRGSYKTHNVNDSTKPAIHEPLEPMARRFGLSDIIREGSSIICSPNNMLSIICDEMGRVILVDNRNGIAVRMWKGYRNAQCGWIEVEEENRSGMRRIFNTSVHARARTALFLVIYAPKKGVIDIWSIQQGPKITTFTASKNGRLLYVNYGLLGMNDNPSLGKNKPQYSCIFMDPLGGLKEITVPFHFALNSKNGKRARDIHLLKKLKSFLREEDFDAEKLIYETKTVCYELKTNEVRIQMIEMLMSNKNTIPDALIVAIDCFLEKLDEREEDELEPAGKTLYQLATQLRKAIEFFKYVTTDKDETLETFVDVNQDTKEEGLSALLMISEKEVYRMLKLFATLKSIQFHRTKNVSKVKFKDDGRIFLLFLSCFDFGAQRLSVQKDIPLDKKQQIANLIYEDLMKSKSAIDTWAKAAVSSGIQPFQFMEFALIHWIHREEDTMRLETELKRFTHILRTICLTANIDDVCGSCNEISEWWKKVRDLLTEATNPSNALTAAISCRAVAIALEKFREKYSGNRVNSDDGNEGGQGNGLEGQNALPDEEAGDRNAEEETQGSTGDWENVSRDTCQFTLLIGHLEDVTVLNTVVSEEPVPDDTTQFFALPFSKYDISLGLIFAKGKGSVSEIIAKWLSSTGIDPAALVITADAECDQSPENPLDVTETADVELSEKDRRYLLSAQVDIGSEVKSDTSARARVLEKLALLERHFPYSLTSSVLHANLCWEYAMFWNKDVSQLKALDAALVVLRQIPQRHMRHGVCCLLWTLHLKKRMEICAKLISKLGKLPKERLCAQEVGLSDVQVVSFLQQCVEFLEIFLDSEVLEAGKCSSVKFEELWEGQAPGPQPFAILAVTQSPAWYDLVMLHVQLANVLYMTAYFNLKVPKPLNNLFESVVQPYFFQDLTDKAVLTWYRDERRDGQRAEFLCRVITASMDFIHRETTDGSTLNSAQAVLWMGRCQSLASMWKINNDQLRIHQVCQLYINGFDRLAEEVVTAVNDLEGLAAELLPIAGRRMMAYLSKTPDLLEEVSRISPPLTAYLESLETDNVVCTNCSNDETVELVRRVSRHLPESHNDYHLARLMLDATFIYEGKV
ncbi:hypothetical protein KM043_000293 [Ampulex compressa]|nr:hypothetical protein KM043_000293 [Ampulex compressa]